VIELAIDPSLHQPLDVGKISHHVALIEPIGADVHFHQGVVAMGMFADALVVEQAVSVAESMRLVTRYMEITVIENWALGIRNSSHALSFLIPNSQFLIHNWTRVSSAVLFSGGLDSAVLLALEVSQGGRFSPFTCARDWRGKLPRRARSIGF